jgi:hypothetical protein
MTDLVVGDLVRYRYHDHRGGLYIILEVKKFEYSYQNTSRESNQRPYFKGYIAYNFLVNSYNIISHEECERGAWVKVNE